MMILATARHAAGVHAIQECATLSSSLHLHIHKCTGIHYLYDTATVALTSMATVALTCMLGKAHGNSSFDKHAPGARNWLHKTL